MVSFYGFIIQVFYAGKNCRWVTITQVVVFTLGKMKNEQDMSTYEAFFVF